MRFTADASGDASHASYRIGTIGRSYFSARDSSFGTYSDVTEAGESTTSTALLDESASTIADSQAAPPGMSSRSSHTFTPRSSRAVTRRSAKTRSRRA